MSSGQRKSDGTVVEAGIQPGVGPVASSACRRESTGRMVWIVGRLEIGRVAGVALSRHRLELAARGPLVAGIAINSRVCSRQGEAIGVLLHLLHRYLPSANCVALFAVCSELPPVNVRMAILAALSNAREHRSHMALCALHRRVHSAQRIVRAVVIEFRNCANRSPGVCRMAVLTGNVQASVRTVAAS